MKTNCENEKISPKYFRKECHVTKGVLSQLINMVNRVKCGSTQSPEPDEGQRVRSVGQVHCTNWTGCVGHMRRDGWWHVATHQTGGDGISPEDKSADNSGSDMGSESCRWLQGSELERANGEPRKPS